MRRRAFKKSTMATGKINIRRDRGTPGKTILDGSRWRPGGKSLIDLIQNVNDVCLWGTNERTNREALCVCDVRQTLDDDDNDGDVYDSICEMRLESLWICLCAMKAVYYKLN